MNRTKSIRVLLPAMMALLYGASPLDLIPDLIPLIGLVDDSIMVPTLLMVAAVQLVKTRKAAKATAPIVPRS